MIDINEIKEILPQAYPVLLIDRIVDFKDGKSLTAIKNVTGNEWIFSSDRADTGIFPETLLIEAATQAALALYELSRNKLRRKLKYMLGRVKAEYLNPVKIGDQIQIQAFGNKMLETGGYSDIEIEDGNRKIANVEIVFSVIREIHEKE